MQSSPLSEAQKIPTGCAELCCKNILQNSPGPSFGSMRQRAEKLFVPDLIFEEFF